MLLIDADTCVPLAIWNVSPHSPMTWVNLITFIPGLFYSLIAGTLL